MGRILRRPSKTSRRLRQAWSALKGSANNNAPPSSVTTHDRILHHRPHRLAGEPAVVERNMKADDLRVVERIAAAYRAAVQTPVGGDNSIWLREFAGSKADVHQALMGDDIDALAVMLRNPAGSMLFYGFESIQSQDVAQNAEPFWQTWQHMICYDNLLQLARAVGSIRVENPEPGRHDDDAPPIETILQGLDAALGFRIEFPNIFAGEIGIQTSRGIANYRAIQALYQAWRIRTLVEGHHSPRVCEIGGGLGRTAYYALKMGVPRYTIIDIPLTGVAQGYFLSRVVGPDDVSLYNEPSSLIDLRPPNDFHTETTAYDLVVNFDSLTEMARSTAVEYLESVTRRTSQFLSINHEANEFRVHDLYKSDPRFQALRSPCWSRQGYVEELLSIRSREKT